MATPLLQLDRSGLYCAAGDFHIDPWQPVKRALITHAHSDHFARGCGSYLVSAEAATVFRIRLGADALIETLPYGQPISINGVTVSFHPSGHVLGSAQIRVEHRGEVWVAAGDYKRDPDPTCAPFEPIRCHTFITEATFALPIFRWADPQQVIGTINDWWRRNAEAGKTSLLFSYALGKAQRLIASVDSRIGAIFTHGAVERLNDAYRQSGVKLPETHYLARSEKPDLRRALVIAPVSARGTAWNRRFNQVSTGYASGWMRIRGTRRRRAVDRGFVLSDHADWDDLLLTIKETGAERIYVTHGYVPVLTRWLNEHGYNAYGLQTHYESGEGEAAEVEATELVTEEAESNS